MFACDFDLKVTFISCGWEGLASDAMVLNFSIQRGFHSPCWKVSPSFWWLWQHPILAPYRWVRYHLKEFGRGCRRQQLHGIVSHHHAVLRNHIYMLLGILKKIFLFSKLAHSTKYGIRLRYKPIHQYFTIS
jgi:hypothetical protein